MSIAAPAAPLAPPLPAPRQPRPHRRPPPPPSRHSPLTNPFVLLLLNGAILGTYLTALQGPTLAARGGYALFAVATLVACTVASVEVALPLLATLLIHAPVSDSLVGLPVYGLRGLEVLASGLLAVRYGRPNLPSVLLGAFAALHLFKFFGDTAVREHLYWSLQASAGVLLAALFGGLSETPSALRRLWLVISIALLGVLAVCTAAGSAVGEDFGSLFVTSRRLGLVDGTSSNSLAFFTGTGMIWALLATTSPRARIAAHLAAAFFAVATYSTKSVGVMVFAFTLWFGLSLTMAATWKARIPYLLAALLVGAVFGDRIPALLDDSIDIDTKDITTLNSRTIVWDRCFSIIREQPLVGIDFDDYEAGGLSVTYLLRTGEVQEAVLTPHSAFLGAFTFGGMVGGFSFLGFFALILVPRLRHLHTRTPEWRAVCGLALFAIAAHMVMDTWFTYFYFVAAIPLTLRLAPPPPRADDRRAR